MYGSHRTTYGSPQECIQLVHIALELHEGLEVTSTLFTARSDGSGTKPHLECQWVMQCRPAWNDTSVEGTGTYP